MNFNDFDEINQQDVRNLDAMIEAAVKGIVSAFGATSFQEVLTMVCYQLALQATRIVIELVRKAYDKFMDKLKRDKFDKDKNGNTRYYC